jgi:hypothetical protein
MFLRPCQNRIYSYVKGEKKGGAKGKGDEKENARLDNLS